VALAAERGCHHRNQAGQQRLLADAGAPGGLFLDTVALLDRSRDVIAIAAPVPDRAEDGELPGLVAEVLPQ
jgi:hypothetical protein